MPRREDLNEVEVTHSWIVLARVGPAVIRQCPSCAGVALDIGPLTVRFEPEGLRQLSVALNRALVTMREAPRLPVLTKRGQA